jgi:hypothetical protein
MDIFWKVEHKQSSLIFYLRVKLGIDSLKKFMFEKQCLQTEVDPKKSLSFEKWKLITV